MELVEQKKDQLDSMLRLQNYLLECAEIKSQIQDKRKAIDATQYMGSDLGGVLALQRRLSTMEGALSVLEPKLLHLQVRNYWCYIDLTNVIWKKKCVKIMIMKINKQKEFSFPSLVNVNLLFFLTIFLFTVSIYVFLFILNKLGASGNLESISNSII